MRPYNLVSVWHLEAARDSVWKVLSAPEHWPGWWPYVQAVEVLREGDSNGVGALHRHTWRTCLPYRLRFCLEAIEVRPNTRVTARVSGDLHGRGNCRLHSCGPVTLVRYDWHVHTTRAWMNHLAAITDAVFLWNHRRVMATGERSLQDRLNRRAARERLR
ncbi:MAG: SRPBCC family protein [Methylothermaceae bacterium]|nr:SRPBCC family protein [Methylothermaceae bacterium]